MNSWIVGCNQLTLRTYKMNRWIRSIELWLNIVDHLIRWIAMHRNESFIDSDIIFSFFFLFLFSHRFLHRFAMKISLESWQDVDSIELWAYVIVIIDCITRNNKLINKMFIGILFRNSNIRFCRIEILEISQFKSFFDSIASAFHFNKENSFDFIHWFWSRSEGSVHFRYSM